MLIRAIVAAAGRIVDTPLWQQWHGLLQISLVSDLSYATVFELAADSNNSIFKFGNFSNIDFVRKKVVHERTRL